MAECRVFLASSIVDFASERNRLVVFFDKLSRAIEGARIETFICEQASKSLSAVRKQDDFNAEIAKSHLFLLLAKDRIGDYTLEEFETALHAASKSGSPQIFAYCESPECQNALSAFELSGNANVSIREYRGLPALQADLVDCFAQRFPDAVIEEKDDGSIWVNGKRLVSGLGS